MGCSPSILSSLSNNSNSNRKDSGLYGSNNSDTTSNKVDIQNDSNSNTSHALANQILVQSSKGDVIEKDFMKKDSIVSVSGFGHITHNFTIIPSSIRRATIGTSAPAGRLNHRKSSLALTPEEETPLELANTCTMINRSQVNRAVHIPISKLNGFENFGCRMNQTNLTTDVPFCYILFAQKFNTTQRNSSRDRCRAYWRENI